MTSFARRLLDWYNGNKRSLPWRGRNDPYAIWVSEIMLQQTRVEAVRPYYRRWMKRFPSVATLARASEREVLKCWEGMGYYARARNLRAAARLVMQKHGGRLPENPAELRTLPGIGRYTAGAIASIAFGQDEPTLDGNIRRVLARVFNVREPADAPSGQKKLWALAAGHLPKGHAGDYNQALMDLGATICLPVGPRCGVCSVRRMCEARKLGLQDERPVLKSKKVTPHYVLAAAVITRGRQVLLAQRPSNGLLGGMWEFPNGRIRGAASRGLVSVLRKQYDLDVEPGGDLGIVRHAYSHFSVEVHAFRCGFKAGARRPAGLQWVPVEQLDEFPMGRVDRRIADKLR